MANMDLESPVNMIRGVGCTQKLTTRRDSEIGVLHHSASPRHFTDSVSGDEIEE